MAEAERSSQNSDNAVILDKLVGSILKSEHEKDHTPTPLEVFLKIWKQQGGNDNWLWKRLPMERKISVIEEETTFTFAEVKSAMVRFYSSHREATVKAEKGKSLSGHIDLVSHRPKDSAYVRGHVTGLGSHVRPNPLKMNGKLKTTPPAKDPAPEKE
ncbi:MAG: hypothetical protein P1U89_25400 [Verrucomicrobiales bacterium]|nr:hypothetical protein [Verrucomicrobiales bacterium]